MTKKQRRLLTWLAVVVLVLATLGAELLREQKNRNLTVSVTLEEAQQLVNEAVKALADPGSEGALAIADQIQITVHSIREGEEKNLFFSCTYQTVDAYHAVSEIADGLMNLPLNNPDTDRRWNATQIKLKLQGQVADAIRAGKPLRGEVEIEMCESEEGKLFLHCSDDVVDACYGGVLTLHREIDQKTSISVDGEVIDITDRTTLRNGLKNCVALCNYDTERPNTSGPLLKAWDSFCNEFYANFIEDEMGLWLFEGLLVTLELTACAVLLGIVLGFVVAIIRTTHDRNGSWSAPDAVCRAYLSVIRGTPVMIQLLIIHFVILLPLGVPKFLSAVLCFGLNSGAYVAEIIRGGMMSVEIGQTEAGRSLGLNYAQTMIYIIIPQAFKAVLPSLANEFIVLLKESSVAFYVGVADLTQAGLRIRSISYSDFMPLLAVAVIYWIVVVILTRLVGILERRLRKSER